MGWFDGKKRQEIDTFGTADWASDEEIRRSGLSDSHQSNTLRLPGGYRLNDPGHVLSVAPTRSGKGATQLIPSLLYRSSNSVVVIDPKGENAAITAQFQGRISDECILFNPWNLHELGCDAINPFELLDPEDPSVVDDIDLVAELIVPVEDGNQAHWSERARQMITGLMLYLIFHLPAEKRNPLTLRSLLRQSSDDWVAMLQFMRASDKAGGLVAEAGKEIAGYGENEMASVRSTAQRATDVFKGPAMDRALTSSDVDIREIATKQMAIYLMIPADKLSTHHRVTRLLVGLLMKTPIRHRGNRRVVFYLDEFASLGYLEIVETAFAQYAGYGVTLWPFVQDISQLKRHYPAGWQSLMANAEVSIFLPNSDQATNEFVSKRTGLRTVSSTSSGPNGKSYSQTQRPLLTPDEFARFGNGKMIHNMADHPGVTATLLFKRGINPLGVAADPYFNIDWGIERAEPNPFLGDQDAIVKKKKRIEQETARKKNQTMRKNARELRWRDPGKATIGLPKWPFAIAIVIGFGLSYWLVWMSGPPDPIQGFSMLETFLIVGGIASLILSMISLAVSAGVQSIRQSGRNEVGFDEWLERMREAFPDEPEDDIRELLITLGGDPTSAD
jgi:type IV secretion system protein VirD4